MSETRTERGIDAKSGLGVFAAIGIIALLVAGAGLVISGLADAKEAAADKAWAIAAQTQAQASLQDARTAQIGMVASASTPVILALLGVVTVVALVVVVLVWLDHRSQQRMMALLEMRQSQLYMPGPPNDGRDIIIHRVIETRGQDGQVQHRLQIR